MEDALNEHAVLTVFVWEHKRLFAKYKECTKDGQAMLDFIKHLKAKSDDQLCQIQELNTRHEEMLHDQVNPSASFKRKKTVTEQVQQPVQRTMHPLPVRVMLPSMAWQVVAPLLTEILVPPVPLTSTKTVANLYEKLSNDNEELANPRYWKKVEVTQTLPTVNLLAALVHDSTARNHSQKAGEGRKSSLIHETKWNLGDGSFRYP
jgi:hypothetical protein